MTLSAEARRFIDKLAAAGGPAIHEMTPETARATVDLLLQNGGPRPDVEHIDIRQLAVGQGKSIDLRLVIPRGTPRAIILYLHGGGWVAGSASNHETVACQIAAATGCTVVLPDYRLAPEAPFPTPLNDCYEAALWCRDHFALPLVLMGDSAGGNLAAAITQRAVSSRQLAIAAQILVYPVADYRMDSGSYRNSENHLTLTPASMAWFWDQYVPNIKNRMDPMASPLNAADFRGLPPALVVLARYDILFDEGKAYADRLTGAGVDCRLRIVEGEAHGFLVLGGFLPAARTAITEIARHLYGILDTNTRK